MSGFGVRTVVAGLVRLMFWYFCIIWCVLPTAYANPASLALPSGSAASQSTLFRFAHTLYTTGEYYRAIGEFQRFLFFHPDHPLTSEAQLTIGLAYFCGERWLQAFEVFRQITRVTSDASIRAEAALWMAETRARGGEPAEAIRLYQELIRQNPTSDMVRRAAYMLGWSYLRQRQWIKARAVFAQVDARSPYHTSAQRLSAALDPPPALPQRSPTVARLLSTVLPGAGQLYTGHTLDGLIDLGLHSALIAGTTGAVMAGLEVSSAISAFFTWGFYQTQMSNAAVQAQDFNTQVEERFIGQLAAQEGPSLTAYVRPLPCQP